MSENIQLNGPRAAKLPIKKKPVKPLTSRLRKSKNFHKEDRMLDDFLDRTKQLNSGEKRVLRKLLKLRTNEDGNQVKVTISGLKVLLGVDIKTVRRCLKGLVEKGFLVFDGTVLDPGFNYSKKLFSFPVTFPGFDLATVFTRKGDKVRYKAKLLKKAEAQKKKVKVASSAPQVTYPNSTRLIDCSSPDSRRTCKNEEDTKVSSSFITVIRPRLAAPNESGCAPLKNSKKKDIGILSRHPKLRSLINSVLTNCHAKGQIAYVSRFIQEQIDQNGSFQVPSDVSALADDLYDHMGEQFFTDRPRMKLTLASLFRFLRQYIALYLAPSYFRSFDYYRDYERYGSLYLDQQEAFNKEFRIEEAA